MTPGIVQLPPDRLHANDYNPNRMSEDAFAEFLAEVKHLGRLPKPVVVRPNAEGMMDARQLSKRALAKEMELSEGTVRNALLYAEAAELLRNRYAVEGHDTAGVDSRISALSVQQVRHYVKLPRGDRRPVAELHGERDSPLGGHHRRKGLRW